MDRWQELQPHLQQLLGAEEYRTWIEPLGVKKSSAGALVLACDNAIVAEWVRDHLLRDIETVARSRFGSEFTVGIDSGQDLTLAADPVRPSISSHPFVSGFVFERFVQGTSNQFAAAAAEAVAERPGEAYNPLYIYGGSGLGKTHLLHAIGHRVLASNPNCKVTYMTTEQFVNELINCIRRQQMEAFRQTFRGVDVLLLDDLFYILNGLAVHLCSLLKVICY